jgi:hypothetical protein
VSKRQIRVALIFILGITVALAAASLARAQQKIDSTKIDRARGILRDARDEDRA